MRLLVGLGNPGAKYESTRHNAGFWWVDRVAQANKVSWRRESRFQAQVSHFSTSEGDVWLVKPETFMNLSGQAVASLANYYKIAADQVLVIHDELDLPAGAMKMKFGGGLSGHNGLRSIAACLNTQDFWRLRLGISHPRDSQAVGQAVVDYVLQSPRSEERSAIDSAMEQALKGLPMILAGEMEKAMKQLHTRDQTKI
jgi:PTH1 family peptidyl-tRNA hydrolase